MDAQPNQGARIEQVVSGGQSGVDRAALAAAIECGLPVGGWCPKSEGPGALLYWLAAVRPRVLNVAGPRESGAPGIHGLAFGLLVGIFTPAPRP